MVWLIKPKSQIDSLLYFPSTWKPECWVPIVFGTFQSVPGIFATGRHTTPKAGFPPVYLYGTLRIINMYIRLPVLPNMSHQKMTCIYMCIYIYFFVCQNCKVTQKHTWATRSKYIASNYSQLHFSGCSHHQKENISRMGWYCFPHNFQIFQFSIKLSIYTW